MPRMVAVSFSTCSAMMVSRQLKQNRGVKVHNYADVAACMPAIPAKPGPASSSIPGLFLQIPQHVAGIVRVLEILIPQQAWGEDNCQVARTHLVDVLVLSNPK